MAGLAAWFAPAVFEALGFRALESVAGGRLAAVGAVFAETFFELGDAGFELGNAGFELGEEFADRVDPSFVQSGLDDRAQDFSSFGQHHDNAGSDGKCLRFLKYLNSYNPASKGASMASVQDSTGVDFRPWHV